MRRGACTRRAVTTRSRRTTKVTTGRSGSARTSRTPGRRRVSAPTSSARNSSRDRASTVATSRPCLVTTSPLAPVLGRGASWPGPVARSRPRLAGSRRTGRRPSGRYRSCARQGGRYANSCPRRAVQHQLRRLPADPSRRQELIHRRRRQRCSVRLGHHRAMRRRTSNGTQVSGRRPPHVAGSLALRSPAASTGASRTHRAAYYVWCGPAEPHRALNRGGSGGRAAGLATDTASP